MKTIPEEFVPTLLAMLRNERQTLQGFLNLGLERNRAEKLDRMISELEKEEPSQ
jgi:hypothetical protein